MATRLAECKETGVVPIALRLLGGVVTDGDTQHTDDKQRAFTRRELKAFQRGTAAIIMPDGDGWRVSYISGGNFDARPGTVFASLTDGLNAVAEVLPAANSPAERSRYEAMEELL